MFNKYDCVKLKKNGTVVFGDIEYVVTAVRGFWIFRSYNILGIDDEGHHIIQKKVKESQLEIAN